jgi:hypothetical protein
MITNHNSDKILHCHNTHTLPAFLAFPLLAAGLLVIMLDISLLFAGIASIMVGVLSKHVLQVT